MKLITAIFINIILLGQILVAGEITKVGTTVAQFVKFGVGARASGMGESYVAAANDASAMVWNPAALTRLKKSQALFIRTKWIADVTYDFAGIALPFGEMGTLGIYYAGVNMNDMKVRTEYQQDGTGELFSASDLALGLSFGKNITPRFAFGVGVKYLRQQIWHETASNVAIDVGITYKTSIDGLRLGMALSNFGDKMQLGGKDLLVFHDPDPNLDGNNDKIIAQLNTEKYDIPLTFRIGLAYQFIKNDFHQITLAMDGITANDYKEYLNIGGEYAFRDMVFLRAGYKGVGIKNNEVGFSLGGGLKYNFVSGLGLLIDYAYVDFGRFNNVQRFSLSMNF